MKNNKEIAKEGKWVEGLPKEGGYYWIRYRIKGKRKGKEIFSFVCRNSTSSILMVDLHEGQLDYFIKNQKNVSSVYDKSSYKKGEYAMNSWKYKERYTYKTVEFDYIFHFNIKGHFIPNIDIEKIR